jgi:hypothetical protein
MFTAILAAILKDNGHFDNFSKYCHFELPAGGHFEVKQKNGPNGIL